MRPQSADVFAFDFVETSGHSSLAQELEEKTDFSPLIDETPPPPFGGSGTGMSFNHLGVIEVEEHSLFSRVVASLIRFSSVPDAVSPILIGEVPGTSEGASIQSDKLQHELGDLWTDVFSDLETVGSRGSPVTLCSVKIETTSLADVFPIPENASKADDLVEHGPFVEQVRGEEFCRKFSIEFRGLLSVETDCDEFLVLTGQSWWTSNNDQVIHDGYCVLEFVTEDSPWNMDVEMGPVMDSISGMGRSSSRIQSLIPLLFFFYWFRRQSGREKPMFDRTLGEIPIGVNDDRAIDEYLELLREKESEFYGQYVTFLRRVDSAESLLGQLSNSIPYHTEAGVPLMSEQTPPTSLEVEGMSFVFDYESGILELLTSDVEDEIQNAREEYDTLREIYEIVLENLSHQLNLELSSQQRKMAESSVELQKDMKELTNSSIDLQRKVTWLTKWVTILTVVVALLTLVLVLEAFGLFSGIGDFVSQLLS